MKTAGVRFPAGGSKDAVFGFLRQHGFIMSDWSDKHWDRADGISLHVYGTGSRAVIRDKDGMLLVDDTIDAAISALKTHKTNTAQPEAAKGEK